CDRLRLAHFFDIEVGYADPSDLPFFLKLSHRSPAFFQVLCRPMDLIEIDHIDIQPAQTVFAFAADGVRRQSTMNISLFVPALTTFAENVWPRPAPDSQRSRDHFLGVAQSINGSC